MLRKCPRPLRALFGPILGALIGLIGGIPGFLIGALIGYLLGKVIFQSTQDKRILSYMENPGLEDFYEGESGLAAWCALCVLVSSKNISKSPMDIFPENTLKQLIIETSCLFTSPKVEPFLIEQFIRSAWSINDRLNPDLLAESLSARRAPYGDIKNLGCVLFSLAEGEKGKQLAREIYEILGQGSEIPCEENNNSIHRDPWKILGLAPGTPHKEVKLHYRRLAKLFHPDELEVLEEKHRVTAAQAFIAIKEAYKEITGE